MPAVRSGYAPVYHEHGLAGRSHGIVSLRHTLTCVASLANRIQLDNLDLFNSAHMGKFTPRFHNNRFRVEPVFEIMVFAAAALFLQFIGFLAVHSHRPFGNS